MLCKRSLCWIGKKCDRGVTRRELIKGSRRGRVGRRKVGGRVVGGRKIGGGKGALGGVSDSKCVTGPDSGQSLKKS